MKTGKEKLDGLLDFLRYKANDGVKAAIIFAQAMKPMPKEFVEVDDQHNELKKRLRPMMLSLSPDKYPDNTDLRNKATKYHSMVYDLDGDIFRETLRTTKARRDSIRATTVGYISKKMGIPSINVTGITIQSDSAQIRAEQNAALCRAETKTLQQSVCDNLKAAMSKFRRIKEKMNVEPELIAKDLQLIKFQGIEIQGMAQDMNNRWFITPDEVEETMTEIVKETSKLLEPLESSNETNIDSTSIDIGSITTDDDDDECTNTKIKTTTIKKKSITKKRKYIQSSSPTPLKKPKLFNDDIDEEGPQKNNIVTGDYNQWLNLVHFWWDMDPDDPKRLCTASKKGSTYYECNVVYVLQRMGNSRITLNEVLGLQSVKLLDDTFFSGKPKNKVITPWNRFKAFVSKRSPNTVRLLLHNAPVCKRKFKNVTRK